jgi:hypothetical protein
MRRLLSIALLVLAPSAARADAFDWYTNDILVKVPKAVGVEKVKELTPDLLVEHNRVLPNIKAAFLVVKTNEGRFCKLLVRPARQKIGQNTDIPIMFIDRFVTYKEAEERTVVAEGKDIRLFPDFLFNLDIGQVVPAAVGGDIRLIVGEKSNALEPVGKAEIYLLTKPIAEATPKKSEKVIVGPTFETKYFNGSFKLYDDGRRSGKLVLTVDKDGDVLGWYYSDKDGAKYEVTGKAGEPHHAIKFKVQLPRTPEEFQGWMFTGDGRVICGFSRLQDRDAGFYAVRMDED